MCWPQALCECVAFQRTSPLPLKRDTAELTFLLTASVSGNEEGVSPSREER